MRNSYLNAFIAFAYILGIAMGIQSLPHIDNAAPFLMISTMLSLLVLSVSLMAVLFFYRPGMLFLEGHHAAAFQFFMKTLVTFALLLGILLAGIFIYSSNVPL